MKKRGSQLKVGSYTSKNTVIKQSVYRWHQAGSRLPLLTARSTVNFPARGHPITTLTPVPNYTAHGCEELAQCYCVALPGQASNPWYLDHKSDSLL